MAATTREVRSDSDSLERDLEEGGSGRHHPVTDEEVAKKPKVKVIQGEIEMTVLEEREGMPKPNEGAKVTVHLLGKLESGEIVDERTDFEFVTDEEQVISGIDRSILFMSKGDRSRVKIPPGQGYGAQGGLNGKVPPNATLVYEVTLVDFVKAKMLYEMKSSELMAAAIRSKEKGTALFRKKDFERAVQKYDKAVKFLDFDPATFGEDKAALDLKIACWNNMAQCGLNIAGVDPELFGFYFLVARNCCDKVLAVESENVKALYRRAQSHIGTGDCVEASKDLQKALKADPESRAIQSEVKRLNKLLREYFRKEKHMMTNMFSSKASIDPAEAEVSSWACLALPWCLVSLPRRALTDSLTF